MFLCLALFKLLRPSGVLTSDGLSPKADLSLASPVVALSGTSQETLVIFACFAFFRLMWLRMILLFD